MAATADRSPAFDSILGQYPQLEAGWHVEEGESGMNNTTRMVKAANAGQAYMLRIYNNHRDEEIVQLEHEILTALNRSAFALQVPVPVKNRQGSTVTRAEDGRIAGLCQYIPGERPSVANKRQLISLGRAAASLMQSFSGLPIGRKPIYEPYFMLESTYGHPGDDVFVRLADASGKLAGSAEQLRTLQRELGRCGQVCEAARRLPRHWIHGDLVMNNTVASGDDIIGLLDFEFCTVDARAMELAVSLMDIVQAGQEGDPLGRAADFCEGFRAGMALTSEEIDLLPGLMKLRMLDVSLHFINRYNEGLDGIEVLENIVIGAGNACAWVASCETELKRLLNAR